MTSLNRYDYATAIPMLERLISGVAEENKVISENTARSGFRVEITTDFGNQLRPPIDEITLTATAKIYGSIIDLHNNSYIWKRISGDADSDNAWNEAHSTGYKSIRLTQDDVGEQSIFVCTVTFADGIVAQEQMTVSTSFKSEVDENIETLQNNYIAIEESNNQILNDITNIIEASNETNANVSEIRNTLEENVASWRAIFVAESDGLRIKGVYGDVISPISLKLKNDRLSFLQNVGGVETEVAFISNKQLYITEANILQTVTLGNYRMSEDNDEFRLEYITE